MSGLTSSGMTAGAIVGGGVFALGSKTLTVGPNNASTSKTRIKLSPSSGRSSLFGS